jgi:hypothetical protein
VPRPGHEGDHLRALGLRRSHYPTRPVLKWPIGTPDAIAVHVARMISALDWKVVVEEIV